MAPGTTTGGPAIRWAADCDAEDCSRERATADACRLSCCRPACSGAAAGSQPPTADCNSGTGCKPGSCASSERSCLCTAEGAAAAAACCAASAALVAIAAAADEELLGSCQAWRASAAANACPPIEKPAVAAAADAACCCCGWCCWCCCWGCACCCCCIIHQGTSLAADAGGCCACGGCCAAAGCCANRGRRRRSLCGGGGTDCIADRSAAVRFRVRLPGCSIASTAWSNAAAAATSSSKWPRCRICRGGRNAHEEQHCANGRSAGLHQFVRQPRKSEGHAIRLQLPTQLMAQRQPKLQHARMVQHI